MKTLYYYSRPAHRAKRTLLHPIHWLDFQRSEDEAESAAGAGAPALETLLPELRLESPGDSSAPGYSGRLLFKLSLTKHAPT